MTSSRAQTSKRECPLQLDVQHTCTNHNLVRPLRLYPLLQNNIPLTNILLPQAERYGLACIRCQRCLRKATKSACTRTRDLEVQLRDLGGGVVTGVGDADRDGGYGVEEVALCCRVGVETALRRDVGVEIDAEVGIREVGVGQTVAELVAWRHIAG